jgi:2-octaprenylphenol hydroxylase
MMFNVMIIGGGLVGASLAAALRLSELSVALVLLQRGAQQDCGNIYLLRHYERARKEDIFSMQFTTYALKNLFNNDNPLLRTARNFGLSTINHIVPLKKMLARHAFN